MQTIDGMPVYSATDLVGFLECEHLTNLELGARQKLIERPERADPELDRIRMRGDQHEARFLADLQAQGLQVVTLKLPEGEWEGGRGERYRHAAEITRQAIRRGDEVIYQACFFDGTWLGFADFLLRVDPVSGETPPPLGWSYEVADTKLARHAKASALLQMCSYIEQLERIQGVQPEWMHVALGGSAHEVPRFRVADYMAYYRTVKHRFEEAVARELTWPPATYPEPVNHCDVCRWDEHCRKQRRADDHLSLVAGISTRTRTELQASTGVPTRRALAVLPLPLPALEHTKPPALMRVREQARLQVEGEDEGKPKYELLDHPTLEDESPAPDIGLLALPEPSPNDLFLDLEGDPFALDDGIDYLFGIWEPALIDPATGGPTFHAMWARDDEGRVTHAAERHAFEQTVDLIMDRLARDPALHVYHYAPYEPTAFGRLMGRYATREVEIDQLFRGNTLVDLYRVVRQGIRASVESYSIKKLEPQYGYVREADLKDAGSSIAAFEEWLELGGEAGDQEHILDTIARYNRDDVISTLRLRDWLEERRSELALKLGRVLPRPVGPEATADVELAEWLQQVKEVADPLTADLPPDGEPRTDDQNARWLLAQLLAWHRREQKAGWWRYFYLRDDLTDQERLLEDEPLSMLELIGPEDDSGLRFRYSFPEQEYDIKVDRDATDPATQKGVSVKSIDDERHEIVLQHVKDRAGIHPTSLVASGVVKTPNQEKSLLRIGRSTLETGIEGDGPYRSARDLLARAHPRVGQEAGAHLRLATETAEDAARRLGLALDHSTLPIQGPPGSGKTWTGARMILDLVHDGRKVGVTANGHKVIGKLLDDVWAAAQDDPRFDDRPIRLGQKPGDDGTTSCAHSVGYKNESKILDALATDEVDVIGGTAWLWSREEFTGSVSVLFIDEAGQFSLANAVAVSPAADSMVLLGDPQQLDQPTQGSHPPGAERSALAHLLEVHGKQVATMPPERGLFLERTWRMHPSITGYTSEMFYTGELESEPGNERQMLAGTGVLDGVGIRYLAVPHQFRDQTRSADEADAVAAMVDELLGSDATWTDRNGLEHVMVESDILVVAPYNDHRKLIESALRLRGYPNVPVGTVDKFQGQQAPISIYSMACTSADDAPRGMEFLYSLNRLNVATSRAKGLTVLVASPDLLLVRCQTPHQMQLANALCRLVEVAEGR